VIPFAKHACASRAGLRWTEYADFHRELIKLSARPAYQRSSILGADTRLHPCLPKASTSLVAEEIHSEIRNDRNDKAINAEAGPRRTFPLRLSAKKSP